MAHRVEVGDGGAHPHAVQIVGGRYPQAGGIRSIGVRGGAKPGPPTGGMESPLNVRPGPRLAPPYRHRPVRAVPVILNVQVALHLPVEGQHLVISPLIVSQRRPQIKILREPPLHCLPVDGRAAPNHLALGHVDFPLLLGDGSPQGPVVFRVRGFRVPGMAKLDFVRQVGKIGVVRSRFQQQDGGIRVFGQTAGQNRAGRAAANYDNVVFHSLSLNFRIPMSRRPVNKGGRKPHGREPAPAPAALRGNSGQ